MPQMNWAIPRAVKGSMSIVPFNSMKRDSWADIASAVVDAPIGFKLIRHSPLGWGTGALSSIPHSSLLCPTFTANNQFHWFLRRHCPTFWFSYFRPCPTDYQLKNPRKILTSSTLSAVERAISETKDRPSLNPNSRKKIEIAAGQMASNQQFWILRVMAYLMTKFLGWLYGNDIYVDETNIKSIQDLQKTHTLVYVPTHKSHLDSALLGYMAFAYGLEPPHMLLGDNVRLPLLSFLMRGSGAFFAKKPVKNNSKETEIYRLTLAGALPLSPVAISSRVQG